MQTSRLLDRKFGNLVAALALLVTLALPATFAVTAHAAPLTSRSIALSSSVADAAGVTYHLVATTQTQINANGGAIIEFCSNSPITGQACTHPTGLTVAGIGTTGSTTVGTASDLDSTGDHATIKWVSTNQINAASTLDITFTGIHNPTAVGTFYARVLTYATSTDLTNEYNDAEDVGDFADEGGIALATTSAIGITAYVQEKLIFCVSSTAPEVGCTGTLTSPSMTLGEDPGDGTKVLDSSVVSTGTDYAQLSTNAASGAIVNLHSSTAGCGGLVRVGATNCDISAQAVAPPTGNVAAGQAKFGLTIDNATDPSGVGDKSGTLTAVSPYDDTNYFIDYDTDDDDSSGVTSPYGSPLFNSGGAPVSNRNMQFTFGVSVANSTPAGVYSAVLNLIATGTF